MLLFSQALWRGQLWRIVTSCLYAKVGFGLLMQVYFVYNYGKNLETTYFVPAQRKTRADMVTFVALMILALNALGLAFSFPIMTNGLVLSLVYLWSQLNKDVIVTFFFGMRFKVRSFVRHSTQATM